MGIRRNSKLRQGYNLVSEDRRRCQGRIPQTRCIGGAIFNLGVCYEHGEGAPKDLVQAAKWFVLAAQVNFPQAAENRDRIGRMLTSEQASTANAEAQQWLDAHTANGQLQQTVQQASAPSTIQPNDQGKGNGPLIGDLQDKTWWGDWNGTKDLPENKAYFAEQTALTGTLGAMLDINLVSSLQIRFYEGKAVLLKDLVPIDYCEYNSKGHNKIVISCDKTFQDGSVEIVETNKLILRDKEKSSAIMFIGR